MFSREHGGLSVGGFRTWQIAALSDRIAAGVSVCWMVPKNNQTGGQSAFTMIHPGLGNQLEYPDMARIGCPKPMMFLCGNREVEGPYLPVPNAPGPTFDVPFSNAVAEFFETK